MCTICLLINKSVPSAKTLVNAQKEFNVDADHFGEVINLALDNLPEEDTNEYFQDVINELHISRLRET